MSGLAAVGASGDAPIASGSVILVNFRMVEAWVRRTIRDGAPVAEMIPKRAIAVPFGEEEALGSASGILTGASITPKNTTAYALQTAWAAYEYLSVTSTGAFPNSWKLEMFLAAGFSYNAERYVVPSFTFEEWIDPLSGALEREWSKPADDAAGFAFPAVLPGKPRFRSRLRRLLSL